VGGEGRLELELRAGEEVFRLQCSGCHTLDGYLAIRPLVEGRSPGAIQRLLERMARPVDEQGRPTVWSDPELQLDTWLGRRMPPFVGTADEAHWLASWLARLGGAAVIQVDELPEHATTASDAGAEVFEDECALCHGEDGDWPMATLVGGRSSDQFYELLGRLDEINEEMPPFEGSAEQRRALAEYLAGIEPETGPREVAP
jgi:mono/diheme cytochrome c family protein